MSDTFISTKLPVMSEPSGLHVATSTTSADTLELRITDGVTGMTLERIVEFMEQVKLALIRGYIASTKFPYLK